jgi:hypothetical protein
MADASRLRNRRNSGLGKPPPIEEARVDLAPQAQPTDGGVDREGASEAAQENGEGKAGQNTRQAEMYMASRVDGRSLRRSGRTLQFATRVSPEFDERIRTIAKRERMLLVEVLEKALEAYEAQR